MRSASAMMAAAMGPAGCSTISAWVSSKACAPELMQLIMAAVSTSAFFFMPISVASGLPENSHSAVAAVRAITSCAPPRPQPIQFTKERVAS